MADTVDSFFDTLKPGGGGAYFATSAGGPEYAARPPESDSDTYTDWMNSLASGTHGLGAAAFAGMAHLSSRAKNYWMQQAQDQRDAATEDIETMTPAARRSLNAPITSSDFWHAPLRAVTLKGLQMAPGAAAMAAPAIATGGLGAGALAVTAAGAGGGFAVTAGQALSDFAQTVQDAPDIELRKNPEYNDYRQTHSEADTKAWWIEQRASETHLALTSGAAGAISGTVGPGATAVRGALGAAGKGLLAGLGLGAGEAFTGQFAQDLGSRVAIQQAQGGVGPQEDLGGMAGEAAAGAAPFALMGGIAGGIHGWREGRRGTSDTEEEKPADAAGTRAASPLALPAPPGHIPGTIYAPDQYRPRPEGYGAYADVGGGYRGRSSDAPPAGVGQEATQATDAAKQRYSQHIDEEPISGQASSKPGTGRVYTKEDITPQGVGGPFETTPRDITGGYDITPQDVGPPPPSSPVGDAEQLALEEAQGNFFTRTQHMVVPVMKATGLTYKQVRKLNEKDLTSAYNNYYAGGGERLTARSEGESPTGAVEQPEVAQPSVEAQKSPEKPADAPIQPGSYQGTGLPTGGQPTEAGSFAQGPIGTGYDDRTAAELERHDAIQRLVDQIAGQGEKAEPSQQVSTETGERQAAPLAQVGTVQREPVEPKLRTVSAPVMGEGLKSIETAVEAARQSRERIAQAQAAEETVTRPEGRGKKWTKLEIAARKQNNKVADEIVGRHRLTKDSKDWLALDPSKAGGRGSLVAMIARLRGMVADADNQIKAGHFTPPKEFNIMPSGSNMPDHSPNVLVIQEARRFLNSLKKYKTESGKTIELVHAKSDISDHLNREFALTGEHLSQAKREEYYRKILPERVSEAEERMALEDRGPRAGVQPLEEKHEETIAAAEPEKEGEIIEPQARAKAIEEIEKNLQPIPPHPTGKNPTRSAWLKWKQAILDHPMFEHALKSPKIEDEELKPKDQLPWSDKMLKFETYMRQFQDAIRERYEQSGLVAEKAKVEAAARAEAAKPPEPIHVSKITKDEPAKLQAVKEPQQVTARAPDGSEVSFVPKKAATIRELLPKLDIPRFVPKGLEGMARIIINKIIDVAGDIPVYAVGSDVMDRLLPAGKNADGLYDSKLGHIILDVERNPEAARTTLFHEAFHAATVAGLHKVPDLLFNLTKLWKEVDGAKLHASPIEWLTEVMTDKAALEQFKTARISQESAKQFGVPVWRKKTIFEGILNTIRQALGLGPRDVGAIEAALAISERAMEYREAQLQKGIEARAATEPKVYYHEMVADRLEEEHKGMMATVDKLLKGEVSPRWRGLLMWLKEKLSSPREWMTEMAEKVAKGTIFGERARMWYERMAAQSRLRNTIVKQTDALMRKLATIQRVSPIEFNKLMKLLVSSTLNGAHPDYELGQGLNKFIRVKDPNNPHGANNAYWRAIQGHPEDKAAFQALATYKVGKDILQTKDLFREVRDAMMEMHQKDLTATRNSFAASMRKHLERMGEETEGLRDAYEKIVNGEQLTKEEQARYGDDKNIQHLQIYDKMLKDADKGPYFPMQRLANKFSITGKYKYAKPKNGVVDPDNENRWSFSGPNAREDAYNFTNTLKTPKGVRLPSYRDIRHYFLVDGEKVYKDEDGRNITSESIRKEPDDRGQIKPAEEHIVDVDPSHVEFANSYREGYQIQKAMVDAGIDPKDISDIAPAKNQPLQRYGFYGPQVQAMMNRTDKLHYLSETERKGAQEAIEHAALTSIKGNYLTQNLLRRNGILGGSSDIIQALDRRRKASASFQSMAEHRFGIDDDLDQMERYLKEHRTDPNYGDMQAAYNTFADRTMNWQADSNNDMDVSPLWHRIRSVATLKYLASPAFLVYHQLHVPLVVIPNLAQHIGWFPAFRLALSTYRQMLGGLPVIGKGFKGAFTRAWNLEEEPHDFIDLLKMEARKHGVEEDALKAIEWAESQDLLHHSGFNFASFYKDMNWADRMEHRSQNFSQEFIGSADAVNRFNSFLMFYRAAKSMGKSGEEAYRWAGDRVAETQGQFTAFNRVGMFRDPKIRAVMQFKSFPLILMKTVTKALYNSLRWGATGEERWAAMKQLGGLMGASMALSGVSGAVPEPIEDVNNIMSAFGLTKTWDEYEDKLRTMVANDMGGPEVANLVMGGLGAALGVDFTHRGGISDLTGLSRLHVTKASDLESSLFKYLAGVPGSEAGDMIEGINAITTGDLRGATRFIFPRMITDPIRAWQLYNEGITTMAGKTIGPPTGILDATRRAFGFTTETEAKTREARFVTGMERGREATQRANIETLWKQGNRGDAIIAMQKYNRANPDNPIKWSDLTRVTRGMHRPTRFGYQESPSRRQELEERARVYGLQ